MRASWSSSRNSEFSHPDTDAASGSEPEHHRRRATSPSQFSSDFLIERPRPRPLTLSKFIPRRMSQMLEPSKPKSPPPARETVPAPHSTPAGVASPRGADSFDGERTALTDSPTMMSGPSRASSDRNPDLSQSTPEVQQKSQHRESWIERTGQTIRRFEPAFVLENSGSVARDHLASERTFLAYMRTSLAIASTGVALVQLFSIAVHAADDNGLAISPVTRRIQAFARPLGATTVIFGMLVLVIGVTRYFTVQIALTKGMFPVARITITGTAIGLAVLISIVFGILVAERSTVH
ncbi:hypothetical protein HGRIS_005873 [Hohenbuehelia grisea]|uniref:DUF202 domain-containing protein n=1 Tax=Hohenbuehelia grisea TaxID=104357 RepID=A0ABR3K0G8_9AGAR